MAVQMLETEKPETTPSTINTIMALITNRNKPNVSTVIGMVSNTKRGLKITLSKPKNKATINALIKPLTTTPSIR